MRILPLLALGVLSLTGCVGIPTGATNVALNLAGSTPVRVLSIPPRDSSYDDFPSQVIDSRERFDTFRAAFEAHAGWDKRAEFLRALDQAGIDFEREALVLIRQGDGSSSYTVTLAPPWLLGDTLLCTVRVGHAYISTRDVQYRCFVVVVPKGAVKRVEIRVREGLTSELKETLAVGDR